MELHFAPLQGYADHIYRRLHADLYGGIDCYYTPFIRIERGEPRRQDIARLKDCPDVVPQIIFNSIDEFDVLVGAVKRLGYRRIDINLGCPHPMQTSKGRGAAMINRIDVMTQVAGAINADTETAYSVKMRLGMANPAEWRALLPILNDTRLEHVTLHPRTAKQMYSGDLYVDQFGEFFAQSSNPVIWSGDVHCPDDIDRIANCYQGLKGVMIGRGMLGRPSLAVEWRSGVQWAQDKRLEYLLTMHHRLLAQYESTLCGEAQVLQKIKPFWDYLEPEIGHRTYKALHKATSLARYRAALPQ